MKQYDPNTCCYAVRFVINHVKANDLRRARIQQTSSMQHNSTACSDLRVLVIPLCVPPSQSHI